MSWMTENLHRRLLSASVSAAEFDAANCSKLDRSGAKEHRCGQGGLHGRASHRPQSERRPGRSHGEKYACVPTATFLSTCSVSSNLPKIDIENISSLLIQHLNLNHLSGLSRTPASDPTRKPPRFYIGVTSELSGCFKLILSLWYICKKASVKNKNSLTFS